MKSPQEMTKSLVQDLMTIYKLEFEQAIEIAMFSVDKIINYDKIYDREFWQEVMDYLEEVRLNNNKLNQVFKP